MSVSTFQAGDSIWAKSERSEVESDADDVRAAVAADDAQPKETHRTTRSTREPRKIAPEDATLQWKWAQRNDAEHVGNIGWLFGNFGSRAENPKMREHIDELLKKQPAMVIGLAECQSQTEEVLQREPAAVAANATSGARRRFKDRPEFSYLTWRGDEEKSVLIGVRNQAGCSIQMLNCEIYDAGRTKRKKSKNNRERGQSYSRCIIAKITLPHKVGFLGREHVAMVVHMHNELANLVLKQQRLTKFWDWLSQQIEDYNVQVLMGDFNMSLFLVIPELRSRGVKIDLGAWYPWKSLEGEPMTDSCGIFFVNLPGVYTLHKNIDDIHDMDPTGILARAPRTVDSAELMQGRSETWTNPATAVTVEDSDETANDSPTLV